MAYITSIERLAMKRGKERGVLEGKLETKWEMARAMLKEGLDEALITKITQLSLAEIRSELQKNKTCKVTQH